jgi:RNA polymerase sigma-70 factor (ECF subfamily)
MHITPPPSKVENLVTDLRRGNQEALASLFAHYREQLRRMVQVRLDHRLNGRVSPSDVLQEAYIDALKRVHHYFEKPNMPFLGWLRLVVGQRLVDIHRQHLAADRRKVQQEAALPHAEMSGASSFCLAAQLVGHLTSPSQAAIRKEALAVLEDALNQMEPLDREVLALRHFEELSNNEVAELLGIGKAAASKRYVRALTRLREVMAEMPGVFDSNG